VAARGTAWTEWLPSLPASRDEVLGIAALAREERRASRVETLMGCEATAPALARAASVGSGVLHIATHGRVDAQRPRLSALALTPDAASPEDASFGLLEILDLDLTAGLVTLSACDTSRGRLLDGEGVLGPAQAFLEAGAATVVATFWRVEDVTTSRFMKAFYARLFDGNMSAAAALRSTQLEEQKRGASYAWAAFGIYGRPDTQI
jgi:CHAT domain-containing protein